MTIKQIINQNLFEFLDLHSKLDLSETSSQIRDILLEKAKQNRALLKRFTEKILQPLPEKNSKIFSSFRGILSSLERTALNHIAQEEFFLSSIKKQMIELLKEVDISLLPDLSSENFQLGKEILQIANIYKSKIPLEEQMKAFASFGFLEGILDLSEAIKINFQKKAFFIRAAKHLANYGYIKQVPELVYKLGEPIQTQDFIFSSVFEGLTQKGKVDQALSILTSISYSQRDETIAKLCHLLASQPSSLEPIKKIGEISAHYLSKEKKDFYLSNIAASLALKDNKEEVYNALADFPELLKKVQEHSSRMFSSPTPQSPLKKTKQNP